MSPSSKKVQNHNLEISFHMRKRANGKLRIHVYRAFICSH